MKPALWLSALKFIVLATLIVAAVDWYQQRHIVRGPAPAINQIALNGQKIDLPTLARQGPVLIYFWATWCGYCRVVSPVISELSAEYPVVAVALQSGSDTDIHQYLQQHKLHFNTVNDTAGRLSAQWGLQVTPTIVIVNRKGEVSWVTSGVTSEWGIRFRLWLAN